MKTQYHLLGIPPHKFTLYNLKCNGKAYGEYELRLENGSLLGIWKDNLIFLQRIKLVFTGLSTPECSFLYNLDNHHKWDARANVWKVNTYQSRPVFTNVISTWISIALFLKKQAKGRRGRWCMKTFSIFWYKYILLPHHPISIVKALGRLFIYTVDNEKYVWVCESYVLDPCVDRDNDIYLLTIIATFHTHILWRKISVEFVIEQNSLNLSF